jgi:hypothetical protein
MSATPKERRWKRVVAEGLLIVFSILLAFGIEAGWSQRGERRAEVEALQGLRDDFVENLREEERDAFRQMDQRLLPFLWDYVPVVTLDVNVHPRYEGIDLSHSGFPRRYEDLLRSLRFENAVEERMNSSIRTIERVIEVENTAERVLTLVEGELAAL